LVPNWTNAQGAGVPGPGGDQNGLHYGYDAARTPWRIALDYCEHGEPRAKAYLDKTTAFFATQAASSVIGIKDGYTTTGQNPPGTLGDYSGGMTFYGPAGTAALAGGQDALLNMTYTALAGYTGTISGSFTYFHASWGVLSLLAMSGNFWDMAL
jgi:hypothetical protein